MSEVIEQLISILFQNGICFHVLCDRPVGRRYFLAFEKETRSRPNLNTSKSTSFRQNFSIAKERLPLPLTGQYATEKKTTSCLAKRLSQFQRPSAFRSLPTARLSTPTSPTSSLLWLLARSFRRVRLSNPSTYPQNIAYIKNWLRTSLLENIKNLPIELRHRIYTYLILSCDPSDFRAQYEPISYPVSLASLNYISLSFSQYSDPLIWEMYEDGVCSYRLDLQFMSKSGMLDYLKQSEYDHLNAFLLALKLFELKQIRLKGLRICDGLFIVETVILDDFISWLWSQVVLDMNPIDVSSCSFTFLEALEPSNISFSSWELEPSIVLKNFFRNWNIAGIRSIGAREHIPLYWELTCYTDRH